MFYIIKDDELKLFDDNKEKITNTVDFMPEMQDELILETNIVTAQELRDEPYKVIIAEDEIDVDVPEYGTVTEEYEVAVPDYEEVTREIQTGEDEFGNPIIETVTEQVQTGEHTETRTREVEGVVGSHTEKRTVKVLVLNPDYEEEKAKRERARLDALTLTAADVERAIYKAKGMDFDDLINYVSTLPDIDVKALKIELRANNFFRNHPYINQLGALLGYSSADLDYLFEHKELPENA